MLIFILSYKFGSDRIEALNTKGEDIMKYLKEVTIIFGITMLGEFLNYLLPFPVPSGVYGLFILLLLLCTGALHTQKMWRKWEISSWIRCRLCLYRQV
ncbi:MAG: CidA/LrgA family protein [Clostridium fessum]